MLPTYGFCDASVSKKYANLIMCFCGYALMSFDLDENGKFPQPS